MPLDGLNINEYRNYNPSQQIGTVEEDESEGFEQIVLETVRFFAQRNALHRASECGKDG